MSRNSLLEAGAKSEGEEKSFLSLSNFLLLTFISIFVSGFGVVFGFVSGVVFRF